MPKRKKRKSRFIIFLVWLSVIVFIFSAGVSAMNYININREVKIQRTDKNIDGENLKSKQNAVLAEQNKAERLYMQIGTKQKELAEAFKNVDLSKYKGPRYCYLTFDDGPNAVTERILNILDEYNLKATFYVYGDKIMSGNGRDIIKKMHEKGHTIGLHSYTHDYKKLYKSEEAFFDEFDSLNELIYDITGEYSKIIRFPGGSDNTISKKYNKGIMTRLTQTIKDKRGFIYHDWNVDCMDASGKTQTVESLVNNVKNGIRRGDIFINVLMHDKSMTADALPQIIEAIKAKGYDFYAITEATQPIQRSKLGN